MSSDLQNQPVPDFFEFLYQKYIEDEIGEAGQPDKLAPVKAVIAGHSMETAKHMLEAVTHFKQFCEQFLQENRPESVSSLSQGFGLRLAGGFEVNLVPAQVTDQGMEPAGDIPVTMPRSLRGQHGIEASPSVPVTKGK